MYVILKLNLTWKKEGGIQADTSKNCPGIFRTFSWEWKVNEMGLVLNPGFYKLEWTELYWSWPGWIEMDWAWLEFYLNAEPSTFDVLKNLVQDWGEELLEIGW